MLKNGYPEQSLDVLFFRFFWFFEKESDILFKWCFRRDDSLEGSKNITTISIRNSALHVVVRVTPSIQ